MSDDDGQRALQEVASIRGQVTILHEAVGRVADKLEGLRAEREADRTRSEDERRASRRYSLGTALTAGAIVLSAVGLFINSLT